MKTAKVLLLAALIGCSSIACIRAVERTYAGPNDVAITTSNAPLPDNAFKVRLEFPFPAQKRFKPSERTSVHVVVTNLSDTVWRAGVADQGRLSINVGNHWLDESGQVLAMGDGRSSLPYDVKPGERVEVLLTINAPSKSGNYILELDVVQENVTWFAAKGNRTLRLNVVVEN
jgi:hypothetical protein